MNVSGLPKFTHPPVVEVVQGIQFDALDLTPVHVGLLYENVLKATYPRVQAQPPLPPLEERFEEGAPLDITFQLGGNFDPIGRLWFSSPDNLHLVQIQRDRLIYNWRKSDSSVSYQHYDAVRARFVEVYGLLHDFALSQGLKEVVPGMCELTYVNHIKMPNDAKQSDLYRAFSTWREIDPPLSANLVVEDTTFTVRHRIVTTEGDPIGRLHVKCIPAITQNNERIFLLEITARGKSLGSGLSGALLFHDIAHETIVTTFAQMTSGEMHRAWGRIE